RIFAAVLISIALLWGWAALAPKFFPELARKPAPTTNPAVTATAPPTSTTSTSAGSPATGVGTSALGVGAPAPGRAAEGGSTHTMQPVAASAASITTIDTPNFTARLSNRGAELVSF